MEKEYQKQYCRKNRFINRSSGCNCILFNMYGFSCESSSQACTMGYFSVERQELARCVAVQESEESQEFG